jgi:phosphopantothenoylcysteine decarboxylase/phosphopantothenate--cysteine ligase
MLRDKRVLVGVCGSIAAYKAAELVRALTKDGADVRVVMTPAATRFVGPATFAALSAHPVHTDLFAEPERVLHVELGRWADVFVVCGATASTLARLGEGSGEDLLAATYLMCRCPVIVAPAMHTEMWEHAAVQRNVERVTADGARLVPPEVGDLASGDHGPGRLADPAAIVEAVHRALSAWDLQGVRVLVTAGPTREAIDPVRYISNRSSGRMGFAIATEAVRRGAVVTIVAGPTSVAPPPGVEVVRVESAQEMLDECLGRFQDVDVVVKAAAVADWRVADPAAAKRKKDAGPPPLDLEPTADIAAELGRKKSTQILIAFAAETDDVVEHAKDKLARKNADLVVANVVGRPGTGFDSEDNEAALVSADAVERLPRMPKAELAARIVDRVAGLLRRRDGG